MKKHLLKISSFIIASASLSLAHAQTNKAFAITGETKGNNNWTTIREIDLSTGALVRNIYVPSTDKAQSFDAATGRQISSAPVEVSNNDAYMKTLIAAAAYDVNNNRLYFTHMQDMQLSYIDLNSLSTNIYTVQTQQLKQFQPKHGEEDNITRMTFGADGNGYALTNNGSHLIKFTTGKNIRITDLGSLVDDKSNGENSVHKFHDNWGGDMVGDAYGNLLLITVKGNVFKINTQTLNASFAGTIKNMPEDFSVNAAVIDADGKMVISSSLDASNYYRVDLTTLQSAPVAQSGTQVFNASDFANQNLAFQKEADAKNKIVVTTLAVSVYPNPVQNKTFTIEYKGLSSKQNTIELSSMNGKTVFTKIVDGFAKTQGIVLPNNIVAGTYMLKVIDEKGNEVYTGKIVVE